MPKPSMLKATSVLVGCLEWSKCKAKYTFLMSGPSNSSSLSKTSIFHLHVFASFCPLDPRWLFTRNPQAIRQPNETQPCPRPSSDGTILFPNFLHLPVIVGRNPMGATYTYAILPVVLGLKALWDAFLFKEKVQKQEKHGNEFAFTDSWSEG